MNDNVDVSVQMVTPQLSADWLDRHIFERQRKRRPAHVEFLAGEMAAGRFRRGTVVEFGVLAGKAHLVNGQHTLAAIGVYGRPVELVVVRQTVADELELARLYNTHDSGLSRTWTDAYAALDLNHRFRMTDAEVNAFGRAAPYIAGDFGMRGVREAGASRSRDVRVGVMEAHHVAARTFLDCLKLAEPVLRRALLLAPVFAIGTYTVQHHKDEAVRFWSLAADDQNLAKTDPPKAASMLAMRPASMRGMKVPVALAQSLALVWNAHVLGRDVKHPRLIRQPAETCRILRTPLEEDVQAELAVTEEAPEAEVFDRLRDAFPDQSQPSAP